MLEMFPYFRAMADRKRLWIVQYLALHGETSVTELSTELHLSQPLVSWHLRLLRKVRIVRTRKAGRSVYCSLDRQALASYEQRVDALLGLNGAQAHAEAESVPIVEGRDSPLMKGA